MENLYIEARKAEQRGDWQQALSLWKTAEGRDGNNVKAVQLIIDAVARGDAHRERTWNYVEELCQTLKENGLKNAYDPFFIKDAERILNDNGFEYEKTHLLHIYNSYEEYLNNGRIDWGQSCK